MYYNVADLINEDIWASINYGEPFAVHFHESGPQMVAQTWSGDSWFSCFWEPKFLLANRVI